MDQEHQEDVPTVRIGREVQEKSDRNPGVRISKGEEKGGEVSMTRLQDRETIPIKEDPPNIPTEPERVVLLEEEEKEVSPGVDEGEKEA